MPIPDPVAFRLFGIDVMWYGILIASGIILAVAILCKRAPRHDLKSDKILDFIIICVPAGVVGSRLYYVIFNWGLYRDDPLRILNLRLGGLAIHGGLIFGLGTAVLLCFLWKLKPLEVMDLAAPSIAIAQAIGRWGNYFNSEAHGGPTDLPWAVTVNGQTYHPTFLYESIWCVIMFIILIHIDNHRKFRGQVICSYGILYSIERFFVESLRTDSLMIGPFKQAQAISIAIVVVCLILYIYLYKKGEKNETGNSRSS